MEDLKKNESEQKEPVLTENVETEYPLSGGETDQDLVEGFKSLLGTDEEDKNSKD